MWLLINGEASSSTLVKGLASHDYNIILKLIEIIKTKKLTKEKMCPKLQDPQKR